MLIDRFPAYTDYVYIKLDVIYCKISLPRVVGISLDPAPAAECLMFNQSLLRHYSDIIIIVMRSQITGVSIVFPTLFRRKENAKAPRQWDLSDESTVPLASLTQGK